MPKVYSHGMLHHLGQKPSETTVSPTRWFLWVYLTGFLAQSLFAFEQAVLPIAFLSPENGFGVGAKWIARHPFEGWNRFDIHGYATSRAQFDLKAVLRHQPIFFSDPNLSQNKAWAWEPRFILEGYDSPFSYYGPGNNPPLDHRLIYEPLGLQGKIENRLLQGLGGHGSPWKARFNLGMQWQTMQSLGEGMPDSLLHVVLPRTSPGYSGGAFDWYEVAIEWDTRDDEDLPTQGFWLGTQWGHSSPLAEFDFGRGDVFAAAYFPLGLGFEAACKATHRAVLGLAPFTEKPDLGNRKVLRGIPDQRLRDNQAQSVQGEIRFGFPLRLPLIAQYFGHDWQIAAFAEAGRVGHDFQSIQDAEWHPAIGLGGRLLVLHHLGAMRGDLGFSEFGWGLYIDFNQAF